MSTMPGTGFAELKYMVVDDSTSMRRIIARTIRGMGCREIIQADSANQAWKLLQHSQVEFIVCDWNMPGMKGIELLSRVRQHETLGTLPFLMVSAESQKENIVQAIQQGVSNYLIKPFKPDMLRQKILAIIRQRG